MRHQFQCLACKGSYFETTLNGGPYMHVCASVLDDDGNAVLRADARDETLTRPRSNRTPSIRSEGAGVKCLTDAKVVEPRWITGLKARIAKEEEE